MNTVSMLRSLITSLAFLLINCQAGDDMSTGDHLDTSNYRYFESITVDGIQRYYLLNLPPNYYQQDTFPLVIVLHGAGGSALQCEKDYKLTERANAENYVIVYPEGVRNDGVFGLRTWNAGSCCDFAAQRNVNDVGFISKLIDKLVADYKIDRKRIYVTGMSNGAMMAYRLACEIPGKIAAIAAVSGTMLTTSPCDPSRAVPVLHIHSERDTKVPPQGGYGIGGYYYPPVDSVLKVWSAADTCDSKDPAVSDFQNYTLYQWQNGRNNVRIDYYLTKDGGHAWPGGIKSRERADTPSTAINANDLIWAFFSNYKLP
ncbi:MAG TPA: PHB depolymerase family esterase [Bacteroidales bacterium]|nr:PHB depolymerase family esterase [Bacteroidales bacterium]